MSSPVRLGLFALALAAVFGLALGVGTLTGPVGPAAAEEPAADHGGAHGDDEGAGGHAPATAVVPKGLQTSQDGYTLVLDEPARPAPGAAQVSFRILGPDGDPVTAYERNHDEDLHLIAVRRDLSGYQHVHPDLADDGTWTTPLDLTAGEWRVFADFVPAGGDGLTLGTDLSVAGGYSPAALPGAARTAEVDGYTVSLSGDLAAGEESDLTLTVERDGAPVTDLQPYLGARGHLVVLRDGDLAYLHVHPTDGPGPGVSFATTAPSAGTYRLFLDFRHGDVVRTAEFTAEVAS